MADDHAKLTVHTPVDEEAKTLIAEPLQPIRLIQRAHFRIVLGSGAGQSKEITGEKEQRQQTQVRKKNRVPDMEDRPAQNRVKIWKRLRHDR